VLWAGSQPSHTPRPRGYAATRRQGGSARTCVEEGGADEMRRHEMGWHEMGWHAMGWHGTAWDEEEVGVHVRQQ
jgi:hypothetical protein